MKSYLLLLLALPLFTTSYAQHKYFTKTGKITFTSKAPLEKIEAKNKTAVAVIDTKSGALQFALQMKGFEFEKALMEEHFNENYVETDKYPKAEFKGMIINNKEINYSKDGLYTAKVKGKLTIHGETKDIETTATLKITGNKLNTVSTFNILISDYKISIPSVVKDKLSNEVAIVVDCNMEQLK